MFFFEKEIINNLEVVLSITETINFFLSPKVQTIHYCKSTGELKVELYVAISSKVTINEECPITVYMNEEKFYVTYNAPQKNSKKFNIYKVKFLVFNFDIDYKSIITFLWDEDPNSSRGTIVNIQNGG